MRRSNSTSRMAFRSTGHLNDLSGSKRMLGLFVFDYGCFESEKRTRDCAGHSCGSAGSVRPWWGQHSLRSSDLWPGGNAPASCTASSFSGLDFGCFPTAEGSEPPFHFDSFCSVGLSCSSPGLRQNCREAVCPQGSWAGYRRSLGPWYTERHRHHFDSSGWSRFVRVLSIVAARLESRASEADGDHPHPAAGQDIVAFHQASRWDEGLDWTHSALLP